MLRALAEANPDTFAAISRGENEFRVVIQQSPAWVETGSELAVDTEHSLRFVYPRLYPALPLEAYFIRSILHVNVDPATGFVCLWRSYRPDRTIVDALIVTRSIMANRTANWDPIHRMRADSLALRQGAQVLAMPELLIPDNCRVSSFQPRPGRQRLSGESLSECQT